MIGGDFNAETEAFLRGSRQRQKGTDSLGQDVQQNADRSGARPESDGERRNVPDGHAN